MICRDIITVIENTYPKGAALEWDNVGLLAGSANQEIKTIYVALDLTDRVIEDAICKKADMILTHHPLIFSPIKRVTDEDLTGKRLLRLFENRICYYAMHTNYDVLKMATIAEEKMGLCNAEVLEETGWEQEGIGRIGTLKEKMTLDACAQFVKETFQIPTVKVCGDGACMVERIAISPGSGKSMIKSALAKNADVLIAGDFDHHSCIDAKDMGLSIIDAGHYGTEYMFVADMVAYIEENFTDLKVYFEETEFPFKTI